MSASQVASTTNKASSADAIAVWTEAAMSSDSDSAIVFLILLQRVLAALSSEEADRVLSEGLVRAGIVKQLEALVENGLADMKGLYEDENKEKLEAAKASVQDSLAALLSNDRPFDLRAVFGFLALLPEEFVEAIDSTLPARLANAGDKKETGILELTLIVGAVVAVWKAFKAKRETTETTANGHQKKTTVTIGGAAADAGTEIFSVTQEETAPDGTKKSTTTLLRADPVGLLKNVAQLR